MKKLFYFCLTIIIILTIIRIFTPFDLHSDLILAFTSLVVLWYTIETQRIRKANEKIAEATEEDQRLLRNPSAAIEIFINERDVLDTRVRLTNLSNYPVAVQLNCNLKVGDKLINFGSAYDGKQYWNLQLKEGKEGHFRFLEIFNTGGFFKDKEYEFFKDKEYKEDSIQS